MDRLQAMQLFVRIAETGSFSGVANQMGLAASAVTRQIAALEKHLGSQLMERSTRRLRLTTAGSAYLEKCRVILNLLESAETDIAQQNQVPRGLIRISMPIAFGTQRIAPLLLDFARRYPDVELDMAFIDRRQNLIEEGIDCSIRITSASGLAASDVVRKLGVSQLKLVASSAYLARHGEPKAFENIAQHEFLGYTETRNGAQAFPFRSRIQSNNGTVLTEASAQGLGISCSPDFIVDEFIAAGRVQHILPHHPFPELGIYAMLPSNRQVPHRVRALIDFLAEKLFPRTTL